MEQVNQLKQICYKCHRKDHKGCSGKMFKRVRQRTKNENNKVDCQCTHPFHITNKFIKVSKSIPWWIERNVQR